MVNDISRILQLIVYGLIECKWVGRQWMRSMNKRTSWTSSCAVVSRRWTVYCWQFSNSSAWSTTTRTSVSRISSLYWIVWFSRHNIPRQLRGLTCKNARTNWLISSIIRIPSNVIGGADEFNRIYGKMLMAFGLAKPEFHYRSTGFIKNRPLDVQSPTRMQNHKFQIMCRSIYVLCFDSGCAKPELSKH